MKILVLMIFLMSSVFSYSQIKAVITLKGTIQNEITKEPISVEVQLLDSNGKKINFSRSNSKDGSYLLTGLKPNNSYKITFADKADKGEFFLKKSRTIKMPDTEKYLELSKDYTVIPIKKGLSIPLAISPFETGKHKIRPTIDIYMEEIIDMIKMNPRNVFTISCFPDNDNDESANQELTSKRCESLIQYFVSKGISPDRLKPNANSKTDPNNPLPIEKVAKGKRYKGSTYIIIDNE